MTTKTVNLPRNRLISSGWLDINSLLIRLTGLVSLLSIPFKHIPHRLAEFERIVPVQFGTTPHVIALCLGLGLLYIANQIGLRKRTAWYVAVASVGVLLLAELMHFRNPLQIALYALTLASLYKDRRLFVVRSDDLSLRRGVRVAVTLLVVVFVFAAIVFEVIDERAFGHELSFGQTVSVTLHALTSGHLDNALPVNAHLRFYDRALFSLLRTSIIVSLAIIIWSLFRPLRLRLKAPQSHRLEAERILRAYGNSSEDFFKLWPQDKHYFFYGDSFVAYKLAGTTALVLDGASGDPQLLPALRQNFYEFARLNGWAVAVIHADPDESQSWQPILGERLFIGSEARVHCADFMESTFRNKHFRYIANKAAKEGLAYDYWQPPLSDEQLDQLRQVSDAWLAHGGRREYAFAMGYFDREYLRNCSVAVLQHDNDVVAYANLIPLFGQHVRQASIDLMRFRPGTSNVAMHYLLRETISRLHSDGMTHFNLGLVPLSKLNDQLDKTASERLLSIIKTLGNRYYSSEGLEQFKNKFEPTWEPRYIVYQSPATRILPTSLALNTAISNPPAARRSR